ncbi:alpha/beta hydrolase [Acuticoccus sp. M5D2P5]|uniref:alpha/beta fold hydrolase n=1 Tax=Acuticoccus kalidii TaxID=2910977 RepID=UPI001F467E49|nr:alpha/beta fold hydrolase [Acuticoccus kalidii]MCF3934120.1 alpha/beta hydrolase [Acuticoccus kalidii]
MFCNSKRAKFTASIAGSHMHVREAGAGDAVLLGHSYLWDGEMWRPQMEMLAGRYRVIAPDLWGHGGSGPLPAGTTMRDLAEHHLLLMDQMKIRRFAVIGLSVGAMWAAELALMAPGRVTGVVLINSALTPEPEQTRARYDALLRAVEAAGCVTLPVAEAVAQLFFSPAQEERSPRLMADFGARLLGWDRERLADSIVPLGRLIFGREDRLAAVGALRMPRLVIASGEDRSRTIAEGKAMATAMDAEFVALPRAGHIASLEEPDPLSPNMTRLLERAFGPSVEPPFPMWSY